MEDFGYVKDDNKKDLSALIKKIALSCATLFSISCFIYVTISAYYYFYGDENSEVETINSPTSPIKVSQEDEVSTRDEGLKINDSIYEDIFGNKKEFLAKVDSKIRISPEPALPPKKLKNDNILEEDLTSYRKKESAKNVKKAIQPIIVYSDKPKEGKVSQDLLGPTTNTKTAVKNLSNQNLDKPKAEKRRYVRVQVAALSSQKSAEEYWRKISSNSGLVSGLKPFTEEVNLGQKGIFFRLQIGNFSDQIDAEKFCKKYILQTQRSQSDCIIVE